MGEVQELKTAYETSLLKKQLRECRLENELLVRENLLLKQQVRVLKARGQVPRPGWFCVRQGQ